MKKAILIIGATGVGKTVLSKHLQKLGHEAYGIEDIEGMFTVYHKGTREVFKNYNITNPEHIKSSDWICDVEMLKELLHHQKTGIAFYAGIATNLDEVIPLFNKVILLKVSNKKLQERLESREGSEEEMGNTEATRKLTFEWKDWWEGEMEKKGVMIVDADKSLDEVAKKIIDLESSF